MKDTPEFLMRKHTFADLICHAYTQVQGSPAFVALGVVKNGALVTYGDWAGGTPEGESQAPFVAMSKLAEMYLLGQPAGLSLTPIPDFARGTGYMGGARWDDWISAVSKWRQEHDRLLALVLLYAMRYETRLHHVGIRLPSEEEMWAASVGLGVTAMEVPAPDHQRLYHVFEDDRAANCVYYVECQWFPEGPHDTVSHWDFATHDPEQMLHWLAEPYGLEPTMWPDAGPNDPKGMLKVQAESDKSVLVVMARDRWWEVK